MSRKINKSPDSMVWKPKSVKLEGEISIGANSVIHPSAQIIGKVTIGENNIIEEKVQLIGVGNRPVVIGNANHIEVGAKVSGKIGNGNILEHRVVIKEGGVVGNGCSIGIGIVVENDVTIEDNTAIWGPLYSERRLRSTSAEDNEQQILPKINLLRDQMKKEDERGKLKKQKAKAKIDKMSKLDETS